MTNIYTAFREYNRKHPTHRPFMLASDPPLFAETPKQRREAMARLRERYPQVFNPPEPAPDETPVAQLARVSADAQAAEIKASPALLLQQFGPPPEASAPGAMPPESPPFTQDDAERTGR